MNKHTADRNKYLKKYENTSTQGKDIKREKWTKPLIAI
jgi:hypothetical protein